MICAHREKYCSSSIPCAVMDYRHGFVLVVVGCENVNVTPGVTYCYYPQLKL